MCFSLSYYLLGVDLSFAFQQEWGEHNGIIKNDAYNGNYKVCLICILTIGLLDDLVERFCCGQYGKILEAPFVKKVFEVNGDSVTSTDFNALLLSNISSHIDHPDLEVKQQRYSCSLSLCESRYNKVQVWCIMVLIEHYLKNAVQIPNVNNIKW